MIELCPYCGKSRYVYINCRTYGWTQQHFTQHGYPCHEDASDVRLKPGKTIRCYSCQKIRRDLIYRDEQVYSKRDGG